jgi:hypothetical protein
MSLIIAIEFRKIMTSSVLLIIKNNKNFWN